MNTKRLVTVAVLIALYTVLSLFSANLGLIKLTFESFPVLVASLMFGWVDGLLVGAVGGLLNQMLTYGFTVTTLMWILPNAVRGLLVGLYAKKHGLDLTMKQTAGIVLATSLLVTALNTVALYIDSQIFHYPISLTVGAIALRFLSSVVMAAIYTLVTHAPGADTPCPKNCISVCLAARRRRGSMFCTKPSDRISPARP